MGNSINAEPDRFFTGQQRARLIELMAQWRAARDCGQNLPGELQEELETLVDAEQEAMVARSQALWVAARKSNGMNSLR